MSTQEIDEEEEKRTTPLGLFNFAESYWAAARTLDDKKLKSTHPDSPVSFLYYHAIELYLKSFLRFHGHTVAELASRKFGHSSRRLKKRAEQLGLTFDDEDAEVLRLMSKTDAVIRSRYLRTGFFRWPAPEALDRTCRNLRTSIGTALRQGGTHVRL